MPSGIYILKGGGGLDDDGQPLNRRFNAARLADRTVDELIGICKGLVCDGVVNEDEARFLVEWVEKRRAEISVWPISVLAERIAAFMRDHRIDEQERRELFDLLSEISGGRRTQDIAKDLSTTLPLTMPFPDVIFEEKTFSFTGKFFFGTRTVCQNAVIERGGLIHAGPINETDYLVIGTLGSSDWIHSPHGRKIEKAVDLTSKGVRLSLVSEEHWSRFLQPGSTTKMPVDSFLKKFAWSVPVAFTDAVGACQFSRGDTLYSSPIAYREWNEEFYRLAKGLRGIKVLRPEARPASPSPGLFLSNWDSPAEVEVFMPDAQESVRRLSTTQGRIYSVLWQGDISVLDTATSMPLVPHHPGYLLKL